MIYIVYITRSVLQVTYPQKNLCLLRYNIYMKIRHWICNCPEGRILSETQKGCEVCHASMGLLVKKTWPRVSEHNEKIKKSRGERKRLLEEGEMFYEMQLELGVGPEKIASETGRDSSEVWYATYKYKQSIGLL